MSPNNPDQTQSSRETDFLDGIHFVPKLDPSPEGVLVGGHVNALKQYCRGVTENTGTRIKLFSTVPPEKYNDFLANIPDWADFEVRKNSAKSQSYQYGLTFLIKTVVASIRAEWNKSGYIHGHSGYIIYSVVTLIVARLNNLRPYHSIYCPVDRGLTIDGQRKVLASNWLAMFALRRMERIIAMSDNIAGSLEKLGLSPDKIVVCPPGIDTRKFSPSKTDGLNFRAEHAIPTDAVVIMFVGNLMRSKGLDILLDAFAAISRDIETVHLLVTLEIAHEGFEERHKELLKFLNDHNLTDCVTILGIIDNIDVAFNSADILVSPYVDTNGPSDYPIAAMEAMASSIPIIGTTVGAIPELIVDGITGILIPPSDSEMLRDKLDTLIKDEPLRREMGRNARRRIEENYSLDHVYRTMSKVYSRNHHEADKNV